MGDMGYVYCRRSKFRRYNLTIEVTPEMFHGDSVIVDYDWTVVGKLDVNTQYFVLVDSAAIVGANDGFPWEGVQDERAWKFTTGPKVPS